METTRPSSRPRRSPEVWEAARLDYAAGCSSAVIAERYGLNARSVRRRAVLGGWRQRESADISARVRDRRRLDIEATPELEAIEDVNGRDMFDLLFMPDAPSLCGFAFRRAAAAAAMDGPAEAAAWLRVARLAVQLDGSLGGDVEPFSPADYARAEMMHVPRGPAGEEPESDMSAMTAEIHGRTDSAG